MCDVVDLGRNNDAVLQSAKFFVLLLRKYNNTSAKSDSLTNPPTHRPTRPPATNPHRHMRTPRAHTHAPHTYTHTHAHTHTHTHTHTQLTREKRFMYRLTTSGCGHSSFLMTSKHWLSCVNTSVTEHEKSACSLAFWNCARANKGRQFSPIRFQSRNIICARFCLNQKLNLDLVFPKLSEKGNSAEADTYAIFLVPDVSTMKILHADVIIFVQPLHHKRFEPPDTKRRQCRIVSFRDDFRGILEHKWLVPLLYSQRVLNACTHSEYSRRVLTEGTRASRPCREARP